MTPSHWEKVKTVFHSALKVDSEQRAAYVQEACQGDSEVCSEVERLLREFDNAGDFLSQPILRPASALQAGATVSGRYHIVRLLGRGGMGEVYEARDQLLGEAVAIKTLRADLALNEAVLRRFQKEIQTARRVTHPNVCRIFEVGVHNIEGRLVYFFTMELLSGETLSARIRRLGRLAREQAFPIAHQMAQGLSAAHKAGVVHRDFKSGNVMLMDAPSGTRAVVTDFGMARVDSSLLVPGATATLTAPDNVIAGTVAYMAPEQLTGGAVTAASDIYSFGIVLFEMATGVRPFDDQHMIRAAVQRVSSEGAPLRSLAPEIDARWEAAIARCLERDPKRRFQSAAELADWFSEHRVRLPIHYWTRREWTRASVAGVGILAAGGGAWVWTHQVYRPAAAAMTWYEKGVAALDSMTYETARKALEQAVLADPRFALAHARLAQSYEELDQSERAKDEMHAAESAAEQSRLSSADARRLQALRSVVFREFDRAAPLFARIEKEADARDRAAAALESGWVAEKRYDNRSARDAYKRAIGYDPQYAAAKLRLALITSYSQLDAAREGFRDADRLYLAASDYEGRTEALLQEANWLNNSGRYQDALAEIDQALSVAKSTGSTDQEIRLRLLASVAYRRLEDTGKAKQLAAEAVDAAVAAGMQGTAARGLIDLGNAFFERGEQEPAEKYFQQGLQFAQQSRAHQSEARAKFSLGSLRVQYDRPAEAKPYLEEALQFYREHGAPRDATRTLLRLAETHVQLVELDEAERTVRDAVKTAAGLQDETLSGQAHYSLGSVRRAQGAWPDALAEYRTAAEHRTGTALAYARLNYASLLWRLGRVKDADDAFREVDELSKHAQGGQQQFRARLSVKKAEQSYGLGSPDDALKLASLALKFEPDGKIDESRTAMLMRGLSLIALGQLIAGVEQCDRVLALCQESGRAYELAEARLLLARALLGSKLQQRSLGLAEQALAFFEPRQVGESVWRAQWIASRLDAARAALEAVGKQWGSEAFEGYLRVMEKSMGPMSWFRGGRRV